MTTSTPLPPLYANWMEELFKGPIPGEPHATCSDCAMCSKSAEPPEPHGRFFSPSTKCCTYLPILPNFLVGRILRDQDPAAAVGRKSVLDRIGRRLAVTPVGLAQPGTFSTLYRHGRVSFGRSKALLCPHYIDEQGGLCGIWKHRESVCSTWFCKHERGAVGRRFWMALKDLLSGAERQLSWHCVLQLEVGHKALSALFQSSREGQNFQAGELDGYVRNADYSRQWGPWEGREIEFYQRCAEQIDGMDWKTVLSIGGPEMQARIQIAQSAYRELCSSEIAERLKMGQFKVLSGGVKRTLVGTYSPNNPLELPTELLRLLPHFDGRPTAEVISELERDGFELDRKLVRRLMDYQLLVPTDHEAPLPEEASTS